MMNKEYFYELGWDAYYNGHSESDNPYPETDMRHCPWDDGFNGARFNSGI